MVLSVLSGKQVVLREKLITDGESDYAWRCDPDLAVLDAAAPVVMSYPEYMFYYTDELRTPTRRRRRFAIDTLDGRHIGNCMYYDIDEEKKQAELGIIIGDREYWGRGYGTDAVTALVSHIFKFNDLQRIYLNTLVWNVRAQRCFEKCGFVPCGRVTRRGNDFLMMELRRDGLKSDAGEDGASQQTAHNDASLKSVT